LAWLAVLVLLAGLVLSGGLASIASANTGRETVLLRTAQGPLPVGAPITLSNAHLPFEGRWGEFICTSTMTGVLEQNDSETDSFELTGATFNGFGEEPCYVVVSKHGPAIIRAMNLPWQFALSANYNGSNGKLTGTPTVAYEVELLALAGDGDEAHPRCFYTKPRLIRTISGFGKPLEVELALYNESFKLESTTSKAVCPRHISWGSEFDEALNWSVTSGGEVVEATLM
jgi:hypothetical protein